MENDLSMTKAQKTTNQFLSSKAGLEMQIFKTMVQARIDATKPLYFEKNPTYIVAMILSMISLLVSMVYMFTEPKGLSMSLLLISNLVIGILVVSGITQFTGLYWTKCHFTVQDNCRLLAIGMYAASCAVMLVSAIINVMLLPGTYTAAWSALVAVSLVMQGLHMYQKLGEDKILARYTRLVNADLHLDPVMQKCFSVAQLQERLSGVVQTITVNGKRINYTFSHRSLTLVPNLFT